MKDLYGFDGIDIDIETGMSTPLLRALRKIFRQLHTQGQIISMAPQPLNIDPAEVSIYMEGSYNCYVPLTDTTIIDTVTYVCPQLYNNGIPLGNLDKYVQSMQSSAVIKWDGLSLSLNVPSSKLVFGYPAAPGAGSFAQSWEADPELLVEYYKNSSILMATGGVMTWSVGWDAANEWKFIGAVKGLWGDSGDVAVIAHPPSLACNDFPSAKCPGCCRSQGSTCETGCDRDIPCKMTCRRLAALCKASCLKPVVTMATVV